MKKTLLTYSNYNSASTQGNSTPKRQHLNKQNIKENGFSTNKEINPFNEENDINSLNIISSPEKKNLNTDKNKQKNVNINKPSKPFSLYESEEKKNYRFLLHQASKNLNKSFSNIFEINNNNRSFSSNSFNEALNKCSIDLNTCGLSKRKELSNLGFKLNKNIRGISNFSLNKSSSNLKKKLKNKFLEISTENNYINNNCKTENNDNLNDLFDENCFPNGKRDTIAALNKDDFVNFNNNNNNNTNDNNNQIFDDISLKETFDLCEHLEQFFILENKIKEILNKLNNSQPAFNESFEWINYYFDYKIYKKIKSLFKEPNNKRILTYIIKIELLCYCLCYYVSYDQQFQKVINSLKNIFEQIHFNFLIKLKYLLQRITMSYDNYIWYEQLYNIIKNETLNLKDEDFNENNIIQILNQNINQIGIYYKLILEDIYSSYYHPEKNDYKFPSSLNCSPNEKFKNLKEIIVSFFYDAFSFSDIYLIEDINKFFTLFLFQITDPNSANIISYKVKFTKTDTPYIKVNKNLKKIPLSYLPKINPIYKYSLVLDLDETLIHIKKDNNPKSKRKVMILRPNLHEFLSKMKKFYELILFSFGTPDYVDPLVNIIEKKEKYFEYRLYRQHSKLFQNEYIKDLSLLGRDIKKIIIVDNLPNAFKLHRSNGICIKGFYGDTIADRNTLKILGNILERIRFDADETNDIRDSLRKEQQLLITKITSNFYDNYNNNKDDNK